MSQYMDLNAKPASETTQKEKPRRRMSYIRDLKEELKRVNWTTKAELQLSTKIVIGAIFAFGIGIYFVDLVIKGVLDGFRTIVQFIFG